MEQIPYLRSNCCPECKYFFDTPSPVTDEDCHCKYLHFCCQHRLRFCFVHARIEKDVQFISFKDPQNPKLIWFSRQQ